MMAQNLNGQTIIKYHPRLENASDTLVVIFDRNHRDNDFRDRFNKFSKDTNFPDSTFYTMSYWRDGYSEPEFHLIIQHVSGPPLDHKIIYFDLAKLFSHKTFWDREMDFNKWSKLGSFAMSRTVFMVYEDELLSNNRFVYGHKFKAYQIMIGLGLKE
ncbi:hypothetical protein [Cognataquiflexum rubidum]|uniref:hypothetical protein n=1 Tax=Cognataquiflexum rubidum TaxID=2922273 RepID=UPI001F132722|nr:hypothetical protein [Cognataquiflexum rubidum]MCH6236731.1 hypothetical protein [Cognataquiflexum rubidum]